MQIEIAMCGDPHTTLNDALQNSCKKSNVVLGPISISDIKRVCRTENNSLSIIECYSGFYFIVNEPPSALLHRIITARADVLDYKIITVEI